MIKKYLQAVGKTLKRKSPKTSSLPSIKKSRKVTVLLVDDDHHFLFALKGALEAEGYSVLTASTGSKGLTILSSHADPIDILLLDFKMPLFDGADTLQHVRKLNQQIKVVGVTALADDNLPIEYRNGVDRLVRKPFTVSELVAVMDELVPRPQAPASPHDNRKPTPSHPSIH